MQVINLDILKSPLNWLTVWLMLALGLILLSLFSPPPSA